MNNLLQAYHFDRQQWADSVHSTCDPIQPWHFRPNSLDMGMGYITLSSPNITRIVALFDAFSFSATHDPVAVDTQKKRLAVYYSKLRNRIAEEFKASANASSQQNPPDVMSPWLWRISLGLFNHDDADDKKMVQLAKGKNVFEKRFPYNCQYITKHQVPSNIYIYTLDFIKKWEDWKMNHSNTIMPSVISASQLAGLLSHNDGCFQGWQHDEFRGWDSHVIWQPPVNEKCRCQFFFPFIQTDCLFIQNHTASLVPSTWSYAYNGRNGTYLSKFESSDTKLAYWSTILDSKDYKPPHRDLTNDVMQRLLPGQWLNDLLINEHTILSLAHLPMERLKRIRVLSTWFYQKLNDEPDNPLLTRYLSARVSCDLPRLCCVCGVIDPAQVEHPRNDRSVEWQHNDALQDIHSLFFPVNIKNMHWALVHMDIQNRCWYKYDSKPSYPLNHSIQVCISFCIAM
jgi:hypothetical protein